MASNQTQHLKLSQWAADDEVLRADFNADNAKIDAAVGPLTGLPNYCGNCIVVAGSYVGTGGAGSAHPCRLSFPYRPMLVLLEEEFVLRQGVGSATYPIGTMTQTYTVSWSGNTVSWYSNSSSVMDQCNISGRTYHYVALLERADSGVQGSFSAW